MKFKTPTEKIFNKYNVFKWIENIENTVVNLDEMHQICTDNYDDCNTCPLQHKDCKVTINSKITKRALEAQLNDLYDIVQENGWEDEE